MAQNQHQNKLPPLSSCKMGEEEGGGKKLIFLEALKPFLLRNGQFELTLLPDYGCYWKTLRVHLNGKWLDLLKPLCGKTPPFQFGSYVMAPWSNRIVRGVFEFQGKIYHLRKNFPDDTAIHGDVQTRPWTIQTAKSERFEARLNSRNFPDFNFPFKLKFKHVLELSGTKLTMALYIENVDEVHAPAGFGFHPFFKRRLTELDQDVMVLVPAEKVYPDEKCIPTGPAAQVSGSRDLKSERFLGNPNLDDCYTGLTSNLIRLIYPGSKVEVQCRIDPVFSHVVIYAPNEADNTPRDFVAVEPVTHVNNGFNLCAHGWSGTGVKILEPGEQWGGECTLSILKL